MDESVSCVLFDEAQKNVLLIKRRDIPVWVLPGGGIDPNETPEAAAIREMEEETGCQVTLEKKVALYQPKNMLTKPTHFYLCRKVSGTPQTGPETKEIDYFPVDALPRFLVPFYAVWINDALANHPKTLEKTIQKTSYGRMVWYLITHPILVSRFFLSRLGFHIND